jgi:hypothetical protein
MPYTNVVLAAFDESGKLNDSEVVAFGGCVGLPNTMGEFTKRWEALIKAERLPYTSMKEAIHFQGPFAVWKDMPERRDVLLRKLCGLVLETPMLRIVSPITTATFKALSPGFRKKLGNDPQYAGFEACVLGTLHQHASIGVHIACDLSEEYSEKCVRLFHRLRRLNPDAKDRCVGIGFADDEVNAPLQAADMIAYCARAHAVRDTIMPVPIVVELIELLNSQGVEERAVLYHVNGKGLGDGKLDGPPPA